MPPFTEQQFPVEISYGSKGGPVFATSIISTYSGHEQRNVDWSQARCRYDISSGIKTEAQMAELIAFFRARMGRAIGFRFKDWSDYRGANQLLGIGDGVRDEFQLVKYYNYQPAGAEMVEGEQLLNSYKRIINKPVNNNFLRIYFNSVAQNAVLYQMDYKTGKLKFQNAPQADVRVTADFEFDVPVRFDSDHLDLQVDSFEVGSWNNITLVELRV